MKIIKIGEMGNHIKKEKSVSFAKRCSNTSHQTSFIVPLARKDYHYDTDCDIYRTGYTIMHRGFVYPVCFRL